MNIEDLRDYVLSLKDVEESFPFGEDTLVFKTNNKIFLLVSLSSSPLQFNVKCNPEKAIELREEYACILPGYHMNKKHWNTIIIDGTLSQSQLKNFIKDSFELVAKKSVRK
ncbi:MAG TPA: MmcQ/YjbR family DNA-binding protein [Hanamia sp.]|jgi:predicted DNA-binding protein (MmcQ/YjbR family)|nr:MmcQ/YjbR family DNA-binding protein [Hanamia sp.]